MRAGARTPPDARRRGEATARATRKDRTKQAGSGSEFLDMVEASQEEQRSVKSKTRMAFGNRQGAIFGYNTSGER